MFLRISIFLALSIAFVSASAQSSQLTSEMLLVRLSYHTTYGVDWADLRYPQICLALYKSGYYRLSRMTKDGGETLQGTISESQIRRIRKMAGKLRPQTRDGELLYRGAESFAAEVVRDGNRLSYVWVDSDHRQPFPEAANNIVDWLQSFRAEGASPLELRELSEQPICPAASEKWVQPDIAILQK